MTTEPITITLAGKPYTIQPLQLGQIEDLSITVVVPPSDDLQENVKRNFGRSIGILVAALREDHPELTAENLRKMRITRVELTAAVDAILNHSGLVPVGEKRAADHQESIGDTSTAG